MTDEQHVLQLLNDLEQLTEHHAVQVWPRKFRDLQGLAGNRQELKRRVLNLYEGSMGSITDLIITRKNGHNVDDEKAANDEYDRLVHELWAHINAL